VAIAGSIPLFRQAWQDWRRGGRIGLFPFLGISSLIALLAGAASTAVNIIWTLSLGMFLEELAMERARKDLRRMLRLAPQRALVQEDGQELEKPLEEIRPQDRVVVRTGRLIPVDGVVRGGQALVNEAHITGHQFPELRSADDWVYGGTNVQEGMLLVEVRRSGEETYLHRVLEMVEEALETRTEAERKADELAGRMVRIGLVSTMETLVVTRNVGSAVAVLLVMSCPCATILAASTAIATAISSAARQNILVKSGGALENMAAVDCACFDKTGTLTADTPAILEVKPRTPSIPEDRILALAGGAERSSQHPVGRALLQSVEKRGMQAAEMRDVEDVLGRGVRGRLDGEEVLVGSREFLKDEAIDTSYYQRAVREHAEHGRSVVFVAKAGKVQGMIALETVPKPEAEQVLASLREAGLDRLCLMSGDDPAVVASLCRRLGFDDCHGGLRPESKTDLIRALLREGCKVAMIGDGVNDAFALSEANVGLAVGAGGSDVALEAADVVLLGPDLRDVVALRRLSRTTMRIVEQNFWIGAGSDYVGLLLGLAGWLTPLAGGLIHAGHTLAIMANSGRLLGWQRKSRTGAVRNGGS
jgi:cation-transporting P-type ATPase C